GSSGGGSFCSSSVKSFWISRRSASWPYSDPAAPSHADTLPREVFRRRDGHHKTAVTAITKRSIVRPGGSALFRGLPGAFARCSSRWTAMPRGGRYCPGLPVALSGKQLPAHLAARAGDHRCPKALLPASPCFRVPSCSSPRPSAWYWPGPWRSGPTTARPCSTRRSSPGSPPVCDGCRRRRHSEMSARNSRLLLMAAAFLAGLALWLGVVLIVAGRLSSPVAQVAAVGGPFKLTDQNGQVVTDQDLKGHPFLVFFGFTHCSDVCPTTLFEVSEVLRALGPDADRT